MNRNALHRLLWTRYVRMPYGHLLDYADPNGEPIYPSAEECRAGVPNVLGWGVCTENGAFFTGLYLYGLCEAYDRAPNPQTKREMELLADGLLLLCDVAEQDGCIARGVATDGASHYPFSSEDQFAPWLLGLARLCRCAASDAAQRSAIHARMIRAIGGVRRAGWQIPTEWPGVTRGSCAHGDWRGAAKLLYIAAIGRALGIICPDEFERLAAECPDGGLYARAEIVSHGFAPDMIRQTDLIQFWIDVCAQLCVRELIRLDPVRASGYARGLAANGVAATPFLRDYEAYLAAEKAPLRYDWRVLTQDMRPWRSAAEAVAEAGRQCGAFFERISPGMGQEKKLLGQSVFGCWIAAVSGDPRTAAAARECLDDAAARVDWAACGYNILFALESARNCCGDSPEFRENP